MINSNYKPAVFRNTKKALLGVVCNNEKLINVPGIQSDLNISNDSIFNDMISPFTASVVNTMDGHKCISYGCSSYGYDLRLGDEVLAFVPADGVELDPLSFDNAVLKKADVFVDDKTGFKYVLVPANGFILGHSVEYIKMPKDMTSIILGKSTYARAGLVCIATPLEAGWEGQVTLEFANTTPVPVRMYIGQGCAQALFFRGLTDCAVDYSSRSGKYQGQTGVTLPKG